MDEIEEFKSFLGAIAKNYTDAQLRQLRRELNAMAELLLDLHLSRRAQRRGHHRTALTEPAAEATMPT